MIKGRPRILLLGSTGQVGWELQRSLSTVGNVVGASRDGAFGPRIDLLDIDALVKLVRDLDPQIIVNAAAYASVDPAENDRHTAMRINADVPRVLGELAADKQRLVVHYSTDLVFSGNSNVAYKETDAPSPVNVYGETKLAGERALMDSGAEMFIFRTSWLYGIRGRNFLPAIIRFFQDRDELSVVDDQVGAPTWSRMVAAATGQVLTRYLAMGREGSKVTGIYHVTSGGRTSWYGFAKTILEQTGYECNLKPISTGESPLTARRPAYSVLDNSKLRNTFGLALPDWKVSATQCLNDFCML